jgi:2-iminobutanoate/2-iminopropanoate deaminase
MAKTIAHTQPHFSPTFEAGSLLFVSGQLPFDAQGLISGEVEVQTLQCLRNLENLLAGCGLSRTDVVKATVWLRREQDFPGFNATYAEFFGTHRPARSTVICMLARPEALVEIEAIAMRGRR